MAPGKCEAALAQPTRKWPIAGVSLLLRIRIPALAVALSTLGACGGAQVGGQTGEETSDGCVFTTTELSRDERSELGFRPDDVLAFAEGEQQVQFEWLQSGGVQYGPESGEGRLTVRLSVVGLPKLGRVVASKSHALCEDQLRVPVRLALVTAGGALDETFVTTLSAANVDEATVTDSIPSEQLRGTFAFDRDALGARRFLRLAVNLRFREDTFAGSLLGGIQGGSAAGDSVSFQEVPLACFGENPGLSSVCAE